jgi:DMSO/TMAO reductase YedYZ molybdopterin-dependent catalytic subunit
MAESSHRTKKKNRLKNTGLILFGMANFLWLLFRTGTKPSRIMYPCQRTAMANVSVLFSISIPLAVTTALSRTQKNFAKKAKVLALLLILGVTVVNITQFWANSGPAATVNPNQEIRLTLEPMNATAYPASNIYAVNGHTSNPVTKLISLMGQHGLHFYKSNTSDENKGPDGLIAHDDVVLVKINGQWDQRGGTNTDILKQLTQAIISHPDGFTGEIVVADNGQGGGSMDWTENNADNTSQSTQDVVDTYSLSHNVSTYEWQTIRGVRVNEYSQGDNNSGYVLNDTANAETGIYVSYPKFETKYGTHISFKNGVWNGTIYENRLKIINLPVLKSHWTYGVTACVKHYMGVQSEGTSMSGGLANGHNSVGTGGMGTLMTETRMPTLNILDATYVNANPHPSTMEGPPTPYTSATRTNVLMASTDPVALDYWAAKHVLEQTAHAIGYTDTHTLDPDNTEPSGLQQAFGIWLNLTKNIITQKGYNSTTDENHMNSYVYQAPTDNLVINGLVANPLNLTYTQIETLPMHTEAARIQCVSDPQGQLLNWTGVPLYILLGQAGVQQGAWKVVFRSQDGFSSSIPLDVAMHPTTILAFKVNGTTLAEAVPYQGGEGTYTAGYPYRLVLPGKYGYKWVAQVSEIELVNYDHKGTFESQGFSDTANSNAFPQLPQTEPPYATVNMTWVQTRAITVQANNTIQNIGFNQTTKKIYFNLETSNPTTTQTYLKIPKRLLTANFTVQADTTPVNHELVQTANNSYLIFNLDKHTRHVEISGMLLTDIAGPASTNPDGKVDWNDITAEAALFGTTHNDPKYNTKYDMNNDGQINMIDIATVSRDYGKTTQEQ